MPFACSYLVEILTPVRSDPDSDKARMNLFAERYCRIMDSGCGVSIPDNPMGRPRHSAVEMIDLHSLTVHPERMVVNLNTFHTREELDGILREASRIGVKYLLIVRGDGGPALPKLKPESIGAEGNIVTSIDLLKYINTEYPGVFVTGAAFNQYNRIPFETDRLRKKIHSGARFVITQPVIGKDTNVSLLEDFDLPVVIEAWMSRNLELLYKSVRREEDERSEGYDPVENLETLHNHFGSNCVYLSMLGFKQEWRTVLPRL
jgi:methylenetetrahydrofolate reductase (NADPH)